VGIAHWDEVEPVRRDVGEMRSAVRDLGRAAGTVGIGLRRFEVDPGRPLGPLHAHAVEEEHFYVLGGDGISVQEHGAWAVGPGDVLLHRAQSPAHTMVAGEQGLDVLAFGTRAPVEAIRLPRPGKVWHRPWGDGSVPSPLHLEAEAGPLAVPEPNADRPREILAMDEAPEFAAEHGEHRLVEIYVSAALGSEVSAMRRHRIAAGFRGLPLHTHAIESEVFVVLEGEGVLELGLDEEHPIGPGHVIGRPAGTGVAHAFRADPSGPLTLLTFGTSSGAEVAWYPRSRKLLVGGRLIRVTEEDELGFWDGEP
jgi:uncharacterized cupin superfamily protein